MRAVSPSYGRTEKPENKAIVRYKQGCTSTVELSISLLTVPKYARIKFHSKQFSIRTVIHGDLTY